MRKSFQACARISIFTVIMLITLPALMAAPKIAVWDPIVSATHNRFRVDTAMLDRVANWLKQDGMEVTRLTTENISNPDTFSATTYDALMIPGEAFPKSNAKAYKTFADKGGILIALGAKIPFLVRIEKTNNKNWDVSPRAPKFAWQSGEILNHFHMKYVYKPSLHDKGVDHTPTKLFKRYFPNAKSIHQNLRGWWLVPFKAKGVQATYYPLLRSQRVDGADVTPQLFIVKRGTRHSIISLNEFLTDDSDKSLWAHSKQTVIAMANIAHDLKNKQLTLTPADAIKFNPDLGSPEPLMTRRSKHSVEPEQAKPIVRWGRFDGSAAEFGATLAQNKTKTITKATDLTSIPRGLAAGASIRLALPKLSNQQHYIRIRGGFDKTGSGLKVMSGDTILHNEILNYVDASGEGNQNVGAYNDVSAEFNRIFFLPANLHTNEHLIVQNPAKHTVYFDAIQIETRDKPAPDMIMGLGAGVTSTLPGQKTALNAEIAKDWTSLRCTTRLQYVGPPNDPKRWDKVDALIERYISINPRIDFLIEGTPKWAAISPERYAEAEKIHRARACPPDPQKFKAVMSRLIDKYGDRVNAYEVWNEADIAQFYRGTADEYATLAKTLIPIIREKDPTARIITTGMAYYKAEFVDTLAKRGILDMSDLFAMHPYAGESAGWDIPYGVVQGALYSHGYNLEMYCNESGFVHQPAEWFRNPAWSPQKQAESLNIAMARLMANGLAKLNIFHAGGDKHHFGLIDENGNPRPAYNVFKDYLPLGRPGAHRLDVILTSQDAHPLQGIYRAAASHPHGGASIVINPAESLSSQRDLTLLVPVKPGKTYKAKATSNNTEIPMQAKYIQHGKQAWMEVSLTVSARTVIEVSP